MISKNTHSNHQRKARTRLVRKMHPDVRAGDDALSNLTDQERTDTSSVDTGAAPRDKGTGVGYSNEERIADDGEGVNEPPASEDPAGSGIASKE